MMIQSNYFDYYMIKIFSLLIIIFIIPTHFLANGEKPLFSSNLEIPVQWCFTLISVDSGIIPDKPGIDFIEEKYKQWKTFGLLKFYFEKSNSIFQINLP